MGSNEMANMSKSGGDGNINSAGVGSFSGTGDAHGHGSSFVNAALDPAVGIGISGDAGSGGSAIGAAGGDITDNTDIGSINVSS